MCLPGIKSGKAGTRVYLPGTTLSSLIWFYFPCSWSCFIPPGHQISDIYSVALHFPGSKFSRYILFTPFCNTELRILQLSYRHTAYVTLSWYFTLIWYYKSYSYIPRKLVTLRHVFPTQYSRGIPLTRTRRTQDGATILQQNRHANGNLPVKFEKQIKAVSGIQI